MRYPKVFICILCWNSGEKIRDCLSSVLELDYDFYQVIVVDNGSLDTSVVTIRTEFPEVILLQNTENLGFTGGNNVAIKYGLAHGADYFWLLNDDAVVEKQTLSKLVSAAESSPDIGTVSPVIYRHDAPGKIQYCATYLDLSTQTYKNTVQPEVALLWQETGGPVCLWGTALLIKRSLIDRIGDLDDRYFAYFEDQDFSIRAIQAGYKNRVDLTTGVIHKNPNIEVLRPPHYHYLMARNEFLFWKTHLKGPAKILFIRKYLAKQLRIIAKLRDNDKQDSLDACLAGIWDALNRRYGKRDLREKMPTLVKRLLISRPYFFAAVLEGRFSHVFRESFSRAKSIN